MIKKKNIIFAFNLKLKIEYTDKRGLLLYKVNHLTN
jgi:hypothetical protein|nr:MAG TPA: hypothetical protein [Caudoviricetes sp.]